jgi:transposase-like protein/ribosomal protein L37AE/L43A
VFWLEVGMARNKVQFQKGMSEAAFGALFGTEERCHEALVTMRWPNGFRCPECGQTKHCRVKRGAQILFQCNDCHTQTSVKAGAMMHRSKLPLTMWFRAMYLLSQTKQGISSIEMSRRLGVTQTTAWLLLSKLRQTMTDRNAKTKLSGGVQVDDAYLGGERPGGKRGRGAEGKTPFVAAVETTNNDCAIRIILRVVAGFRKQEITKLTEKILAPEAIVTTDGLSCFTAIAESGRIHKVIITGSGKQAARKPAFKWVNTVLGNIKAALVGTYRSIRPKHAVRYLAEFEWRFNNRYDLADMIRRLATQACKSPPMPYKFLKMAEASA